jgi:hypothetical protein
MQLVIPGLVDLPRTDVGAAAVYQVNEAAGLGVYPLVPLPAELDQWGRDVVGGSMPDRVRVLAVTEQETEQGWPITVSVSELVDPATGAATELRMHFLFRFVEYGGIAILKATNGQALEAAFDFLKPLIGHARPDFSGDDVPALAMIWSGM